MNTKISRVLNLPCEKLTKYNKVLSYILLFIGMILIVRYQLRLIHLVEWGDESETIVVTKMMAAGYRLYTEVYNNHGPLVFLPGFIISSLGKYGISVYRLPIVFLQICALLSVYYSPIFISKAYRNYFTLIFGTVMIIFLPKIYGHTYLYQVISGLFVVITLMMYSIPSILDLKSNKYIVVFGSFLIICVPFLAITYLPMTLILLLVSYRRKDSILILIGILISLSFNFWFLLSFGSLDGYIAYHFYLNSNVLYQGVGILGFIKTIFSYFTTNILHFLSMCIVLIIVSKLNKSLKITDYWRAFLLIPMMLSLVMRGGDLFSLSGLVYLYVLLGLSSILFINIDVTHSFSSYVNEVPLIILAILCLIVLYLPIPTDGFYIKFLEYSEFSRIAKKITTEDDKVLVLSFRSYEYILSDRLPASTHFIYLSIQAKYNQNPYKDVYVSIVEDVVKNRPKIISIDKWNIVLDESDLWDNYASDLMEVVYEYYYQLKDTNIYIRNDVNLLDYGLDPYYGYEITE